MQTSRQQSVLISVSRMPDICKLKPTSSFPATFYGALSGEGWLTPFPIDDHGFALHKSAFRDALSLWHDWSIQLEYAFPCKTGGLPAVRRNEVRESERCHSLVADRGLPYTEPHFSGETIMSHHSANTECTDSGEADLRRHFWM